MLRKALEYYNYGFHVISIKPELILDKINEIDENIESWSKYEIKIMDPNTITCCGGKYVNIRLQDLAFAAACRCGMTDVLTTFLNDKDKYDIDIHMFGDYCSEIVVYSYDITSVRIIIENGGNLNKMIILTIKLAHPDIDFCDGFGPRGSTGFCSEECLGETCPCKEPPHINKKINIFKYILNSGLILDQKAIHYLDRAKNSIYYNRPSKA